ncbi:hypothetical protein RJ641_025849 [Dillenia turbinata]|uniref:Uncharacterized protein n=1 Tax=Dillenia turbinata TaxID=194707 RepID=A0AAN8ZPC4_9MAGN
MHELAQKLCNHAILQAGDKDVHEVKDAKFGCIEFYCEKLFGIFTLLADMPIPILIQQNISSDHVFLHTCEVVNLVPAQVTAPDTCSLFIRPCADGATMLRHFLKFSLPFQLTIIGYVICYLLGVFPGIDGSGPGGTEPAPTLLLKMPPTSLGWAFVMVSCLSFFSSFLGFYSQLTHFCFLTHIWLIFASSIAQLLSILVLFTKEKSSLSMLKSPRDPSEAKVLVRVEYGVFMSMFVMQLMVLALTCAVQSCWVREYEGLQAEREAMARKRSRRIAEVQEESMANAAKMAEFKAKELDEKVKSKYCQWMKTDVEA